MSRTCLERTGPGPNPHPHALPRARKKCWPAAAELFSSNFGGRPYPLAAVIIGPTSSCPAYCGQVPHPWRAPDTRRTGLFKHECCVDVVACSEGLLQTHKHDVERAGFWVDRVTRVYF